MTALAFCLLLLAFSFLIHPPSPGRLATLQLNNTKMGEKGASALGLLLEHNISLVDLHVSSNELGDAVSWEKLPRVKQGFGSRLTYLTCPPSRSISRGPSGCSKDWLTTLA